jgi:hypothetical protein
MKTNQLLRAGLCVGLLLLNSHRADASIAYGTINNFDTVNDTSNVCHGFEIELDDCGSADITYCYSYNHYGTPDIRQDTVSVPGHTNCFVRYAAIYSNGVWSAYTAIPTGPIAPTLGHSFTNPGLNFGGEHFGVGYYGNPTAVKYNCSWTMAPEILSMGRPSPFPLRSLPIIPPLRALPRKCRQPLSLRSWKSSPSKVSARRPGLNPSRRWRIPIS